MKDGQVEVWGDVVSQHPGEHGVLQQVIQCPARQPVELHQVLEVDKVSMAP